MGKQGSPKSPRPKNQVLDASYGVREYQSRCSEMQQSGDPSLGRRGSGGDKKWDKVIFVNGFRNDSGKFASGNKGVYGGKKHMWWLRRHFRLILLTFVFVGFLLVLDSLFFTLLDAIILKKYSTPGRSTVQEKRISANSYEERNSIKMYDRLLNLSSSSLAEREFKQGASKFWEELYPQASLWQPCADKKSPKGQGNPGTALVLS